MADSKARLHCCGAHHGDDKHPTGVTLSIETSRGAIQCYGTGENLASVILFPPSDQYPYTSTETRVLADTLARGTNVTVLVPDLTVSPTTTTKRRREEEEEDDARVDKEAGMALLKRTLRKDMDVSFIGSLETMNDDSNNVDKDLDCCVKLFSQDPTRQPNTHTLYLTHSIDEKVHDADVTETIGDFMVRQVTIKSPHASRVLTSPEHEGYPETMKHLLYFFKKHLHDWS